MNRIDTCFQSKSPFIGYITAGHKGIEKTVSAALALVSSGVDLLEIGIPFTDPVADGPVIQSAMKDALMRGTTTDDVFHIISEIRKLSDVPIVLFSYLNPILANKDTFFKKAKASGADGLLIVDLPFEESKHYRELANCEGLQMITLISPSTPPGRIELLAKHASGFLYYVCRKGVTGVKSDLPESFSEKVNEIKRLTDLPVAVGFGISTSTQAKKVLEHVDGFVVGSAFVKAIEACKTEDDLKCLTKNIDPRKHKNEK